MMNTHSQPALRRYDYTEGPLKKALLHFFFPSCAEQLMYNLEEVIEAFWIGRLGSEYWR